MRKLALPLLLVPFVLAACGDDGGGAGLGDLVPADPAYFANQVFECGTPGEPPSCPPFSCEVDGEGTVSNCDDICSNIQDSRNCTHFAFTGPMGLALCVPSECIVDLDGNSTCSDDCSEDHITCYYLDDFENACGF